MYKRQLQKLSRTRLDDVLIDEGVLERAHVEDAQAESEMTGRSLAHILFEREEIDEWELAKIVARNYSLPFVDVMTYSSPREAEALLDIDYCRRNLLLPFDVFGAIPAIAVCEMPPSAVLDEIEQRCGHLPFLYVSPQSRILEALDARKADGAAPATAADMPAAAAPLPPQIDSAQPAATEAAAPAAPARATLDDLQPVSMRLGFNMHLRTATAAAPMPPPVARKTARRPPSPADADPPFVAAGAVDPAQQEAPAGDDASGGSAAWQSIFDIGDESTG
jgi:hypothetical protein